MGAEAMGATPAFADACAMKVSFGCSCRASVETRSDAKLTQTHHWGTRRLCRGQTPIGKSLGMGRRDPAFGPACQADRDGEREAGRHAEHARREGLDAEP